MELGGAADGGVFLLDFLDVEGVDDVEDDTREQIDGDIKRQVWSILADSWKERGSESSVAWEDIVRFLGIPLG